MDELSSILFFGGIFLGGCVIATTIYYIGAMLIRLWRE